YRDVNILLIDATNPFGNFHVFPAGILREPLKEIKRADLIILTKTNFVSDVEDIVLTVKKYNKEAKVLHSIYEPVCLIDKHRETFSLKSIAGTKIICISSIANPEFFQKQLEELGAVIEDKLVYPDHYFYSQKDADEISELCDKKKIDYVVTTYKDLVKFDKLEHNLPLLFLDIELRIEGLSEDGFLKQIICK
ncbi:tetraacyldisaccharide 4'-kinase, partial [bacterium]|nr:tetraacyldisaccharide 4'-kinase [bacterium]